MKIGYLLGHNKKEEEEENKDSRASYLNSQ